MAVATRYECYANMKQEKNNPIVDSSKGMQGIFKYAIKVAIYGIKILLVIGSIYWLWLAIQMKSFSMFLFGCLPPLWLVTGPTGAYALVVNTPMWVIDMFGLSLVNL